MNVFSLRAECVSDTDKLRSSVGAAFPMSVFSMHSDEGGLPDQEVEIRTELGLEELQAMIRSIPDGHVMLQTLQAVPLAENSLERDYDRC